VADATQVINVLKQQIGELTANLAIAQVELAETQAKLAEATQPTEATKK
jgi:hypothetical protein